MKEAFFVITLCVVFISCNKTTPKINHQIKVDTVATVDNRLRDSTKLIVSSLPIKFDSIDVIIHAVGLVDVKERGLIRKIGSGSYESTNGSSYFNGDQFSGKFINIIFNDGNAKRTLTRNKLTINNGKFLREIYKINKNGYILYSVFDRDTNGDGQFDGNDVEALYISSVNGTKLTKLTKELHELYDYRILASERRLYFRTLEDINKDGILNNQDQFHYYFLQFNKVDYLLKEYFPLKVLEY